MTKKIAMLSGKGGSGKTSLSLCIANLLSSSGIKTLLVDCDLSTNGATYFFEKYLKIEKNFCSVQNLIENVFQEDKIEKSILSIKENFDFIPSVPAIDGSILDPGDSLFFSFEIFDSFIEKYDVVLFDCQAGYSEILKDIVKNVNATMFVMEADAISSASIRALHLKIGSLLTRQAYQVFNKVTKEEYDVYNKISGGTFFTNIESILFDWTIRKAFALSQIPSMDSVGVQFYEQILNVCRILFSEEDYLEKLNSFSRKILLRKVREEKALIVEKLNEKKHSAQKTMVKLFPTIIALYFIVAFVCLFWVFVGKHIQMPKYFDFDFFVMLFSAIAGALSMVTGSLMMKRFVEGRDNTRNLNERLIELQKEEKKYV